jgi:tetratricopeptide (TPR) repeat protein
MGKSERSSQEIGNLFEQASIPVLKKLFETWGYTCTNIHRQKSGLQLGGDILFEFFKDGFPLHVFVECKASLTLNAIPLIELKDKIDQYTLAGFPRKDIHVFLSLTRSIAFDNLRISIEDDSLPFIVMDWMAKEGTPQPLMDLFFTFGGNCAEVEQYKKELLVILEEYTPTRTFDEAAKELHSHFTRRVHEYHGNQDADTYQYITGSFWQQIKHYADHHHINDYYIKTDSKQSRLQEVVANDLYIRNREMETDFNRYLEQAREEASALIEILSKGGEGKSTFLYHIAKTYYRQFNIFYLHRINDTVLNAILSAIKRLNDRIPVMFILDNAALFSEELLRCKNLLDVKFKRFNWLFVLAERDGRYKDVDGLEEFRRIFNRIYPLNYKTHKTTRQDIFEKLTVLLNIENKLGKEKKEELRTIYFQDKRHSVTECTYILLKHLTPEERVKINFIFDWEDWEDSVKNKGSELINLYLLLSTFYQFGFSLHLEFCAEFLKVGPILLNKAIDENRNLPIYKKRKHLHLRHETIANWYLEDRTNKENSITIFKDFLNEVDTDFARDLFIRLYKNKEFLASYLSRLLSIEIKEEVMSNFIKNHPGELKCRTELSKIYQQQKKWEEAEQILLDLKRLDPDNLMARTELSKIYQQQKKWDLAIRYLEEYIELDPKGLHPRTELSKIYQQQKKWEEAIRYLEEYIELDPKGLHPRTELSKIYQQQKKWEEAEQILLDLKRLDPDNLMARTELSKIYQQQKKWEEAEHILKECLEIKPDDLNAKAELSKVYQKQNRWGEAESLLNQCLETKKNDINAMLELARVYRNTNRPAEAENYLDKILSIEPENLHCLTERSILYTQIKKYHKREKILFDIYRLNPDDIHNLTALSNMFTRFKKFRIALELLQKVLTIKQHDIMAVIAIICLYIEMNDRESVRRYYVRGQNNLKYAKYSKYKDRFLSLNLETDKTVTLLELNNNTGTYGTDGKQWFIETPVIRYPLMENATCNNKVKSGDRVFFGTYRKEGKPGIYANFIEPWFENIRNLDALK